LAHADINILRWSDIENDAIYTNRKKTNDAYAVPLTTMAKALIGNAPTDKSELIFKATSNQLANRYLREINTVVATRRPLTFHLARHTFGTLCAYFDIDQRSIMSMMGHKKMETSLKYVENTSVTGTYNNNGVSVPTNKFAIKGGVKNGAEVVPIHPKSKNFK
jgi:integrase/recombinase XerD